MDETDSDDFYYQLFEELAEAGIELEDAQTAAEIIANTEPEERTADERGFLATIYQQLTADLPAEAIPEVAQWFIV